MLAIEALSAACAVTGRIAVETNMGAISAVMAYGSEEQKKMAADMVLAGDKPAICITEPDAGSDASGMTTRADKKGNRYVINGRKHWITGGGVSRLHLIFAKVYDEKGNERRHRRLPRHPRRDQGPEDHQARADHGAARHSRGGDRLRGHGCCRPRRW